MKVTRTILDEILVGARKELAEAQQRLPMAELKKRILDAPEVRSFKMALQRSFGLIAEIKERSPSHGLMRPQNVADAPQAYERSGIVRAISVLTNTTYFGMNTERLASVRACGTKPVLRKDFIFDEYQVYEARVFGADAILLMANLLEADEMRRLHALAGELKMEVLFECHTRDQIAQVPAGAEIYGINSRTFDTDAQTYKAARQQSQAGSKEDPTTDANRFELGQHLPAGAIKVAESGVRPETICDLRDRFGYHAVLVGTSLLAAHHGVLAELELFEKALRSGAPTESAVG
jgi:indole-3-glycerol phosphate synthase